MHYYPFHIALFSLHASHLSLEEEAVYRRLLDYYYDTESPIPIETQSVIRRLRLGSYSDIVGSILSEFFILQDDGWHNLRADIEILDYNSKADTARKNGKKGGRPKKNKGLETQPVNLANPDLTHEKPNKNKNKNKELGISLKGLSANTDDPVRPVFDYWCLVMNKNKSAKLTTTRKSCIKARIREGYSVDQIKQAIDGCAKSSYHMGQNDNGTVYDDLTLICRSGDKLEWFLSNISKVVTNSGVKNGQRKESLAERSARQSAEILARIEAEEADQCSMDENDPALRPQVGQPGRSSHDRERGLLDGVSVVVPENGALGR